MQCDTQLFLDILPAPVLKSRAYMRAPVRTHAHTHTPTHAPTRPAHTRPVCVRVRAPTRSRAPALPCVCPCASDHTPRNAPVSLSEPPHAVFHPSPVCLPSQPVKRLTEPYRRLYSRFPSYARARVCACCHTCSTLHSVDPPTLCKMPNREKIQKTA